MEEMAVKVEREIKDKVKVVDKRLIDDKMSKTSIIMWDAVKDQGLNSASGWRRKIIRRMIRGKLSNVGSIEPSLFANEKSRRDRRSEPVKFQPLYNGKVFVSKWSRNDENGKYYKELIEV